ncbi:jg805, partial [Pararge aegeria aegeria]
AKTAGKKLGILNKVKRYITPKQLLTLYQAQVRSCMEYCSHLWDGSAKYQLDALDSVDRRARRLIDDLANKKLKSLEHRRKVACLSVFYRIYFGECAQELFDLVPPSPFYHRTARHRKDLHLYVVDIPRTRTKRFASSFLIRTDRIWNALPASIFPSSYNISTFKSRVNRHLLGKRAPP